MMNNIPAQALEVTRSTLNELSVAYDPSVPVAKFIKSMKLLANRAYMSEDIETYNEIQEQISEVKESEQQIKADSNIDTWSEKGVVRLDTIESMKRFVKTWAKLASVSNAKSINSYRFAIGEMVKMKSNNWVGKIVGMRRANGTGKQVYQVKLVNNDSVKEVGVNDIKRYV